MLCKGVRIRRGALLNSGSSSYSPSLKKTWPSSWLLGEKKIGQSPMGKDETGAGLRHRAQCGLPAPPSQASWSVERRIGAKGKRDRQFHLLGVAKPLHNLPSVGIQCHDCATR